MKLIVGLGNPEDKYRNTRHNVGFLVIDKLAGQTNQFRLMKKFNSFICKLKTENYELLLAKPDTFMNRSGEAVKRIVNSYQLPVDSLYVIHDDLDIPLGSYKIQLGKGPKEHRGIVSIEQALADKNFWRVRIGVDNRPMANGKWQMVSGDEYVLGNFPKEEKKVIDGIVEEVVNKLWAVLNQ